MSEMVERQCAAAIRCHDASGGGIEGVAVGRLVADAQVVIRAVVLAVGGGVVGEKGAGAIAKAGIEVGVLLGVMALQRLGCIR